MERRIIRKRCTKGDRSYCCVPQCNSRAKNNPQLSFHRFPKDELRRLQWIRLLRIGKFVTERMIVCSKHFKNSDFVLHNVPTKRPNLEKTAVPSLYLPVSKVSETEQRYQNLIGKKVMLRLSDDDEDNPNMDSEGKKPNELWTPKNSSVVCSRHFTPTDFKNGLKYKTLMPYAIPSVFTDDPRRIRGKVDPSDLNSSGEQLRIIAVSSENLPVSTAKTFISNGKETSQESHPLDPKLVQVWSCSKVGSDSKPTIATNSKIDDLPSFMKQALLEKEKIDRTYEGTSTANINNLMGNGNLQSDHSELENSNISNIKIELDSSEEDNASNSTCITVPYLESLDPSIPSNACIQPNELSSASKVMCDASTSTHPHDNVAYLKMELEICKKKINVSRNKTRNLQQVNRRLRKRILDMKHIVFCELQSRHYLSKNSDFNVEKQGCLLDRHSVAVVESSEAEECEED